MDSAVSRDATPMLRYSNLLSVFATFKAVDGNAASGLARNAFPAPPRSNVTAFCTFQDITACYGSLTGPAQRLANCSADTVHVEYYRLPQPTLNLAALQVMVAGNGNSTAAVAVVGVVYSDEGGRPGKLLGRTAAGNAPRFDGAFCLRLPFNQSGGLVIAGTGVWLGELGGAIPGSKPPYDDGDIGCVGFAPSAEHPACAYRAHPFAKGPPAEFGPALPCSSSLSVFATLKTDDRAVAAGAAPRRAARANVVVFFIDDLGYGDLGCFGAPTVATPAIDRIAAEGMKLTTWYSAAPVCTPSRAGLLTGRLPKRTGLCGPGVFWCNSLLGMYANETTWAQALRDQAGYRTVMVGKWHLGHTPGHRPVDKGFDSALWLPYSHDIGFAYGALNSSSLPQPKCRPYNLTYGCPPVPLLTNKTEIVQQPVVLQELTARYAADRGLGRLRRSVRPVRRVRSPALAPVRERRAARHLAEGHVRRQHRGAGRCRRAGDGRSSDARRAIDARALHVR